MRWNGAPRLRELLHVAVQSSPFHHCPQTLAVHTVSLVLNVHCSNISAHERTVKKIVLNWGQKNCICKFLKKQRGRLQIFKKLGGGRPPWPLWTVRLCSSANYLLLNARSRSFNSLDASCLRTELIVHCLSHRSDTRLINKPLHYTLPSHAVIHLLIRQTRTAYCFLQIPQVLVKRFGIIFFRTHEKCNSFML